MVPFSKEAALMSRRRRLLVIAVTVGTAVAITATGSSADPNEVDSSSGGNFFAEQLSGYNEVPLALSTPGKASVRLFINDRAQEINWRLSYADFPTAVTQAHIHFGSQSQSGGVVLFFCSNLGNGPAGTQACPAAPAEISGTIRPADIVAGAAAQGIAAGEFAEVLAAIRAGSTYANVHTVERAPGEVRAQLDRHH
jgi:CHRD domain